MAHSYFYEIDLTTYEGRLEAFNKVYDPELGLTGDIITLKPEFVEYKMDDTLTVRFHPKEWQLNGLGYVQGGFLSAMIDVVCGPMSDVCSQRHSAGTLDMLTNYFRPVTMDDTDILVKARITMETKRVMHIEAELLKADGKGAVTASTNIMKRQ